MSIPDIVRLLQAHGGTLSVDGGRLKITAPEPLPDELMDRLRTHKTEIVAALGSQAAEAHDGLPPVHDAPDPHATPTAPCATCGGVAWHAESHDWQWQWVCGQCRPAPLPGAPSGGDAPRPRTAAQIVAALPQAPCHGGCGKSTPYGWLCLPCRASLGESTS